MSEIPESNWRPLLGKQIYCHYTNLAYHKILIHFFLFINRPGVTKNLFMYYNKCMDNDKIKELVLKAQDRDREAFAELFDLYYNKVLRYVFRRTLDVECSKDITSNVFLKVLKNLDRFEWRGGPFSFTAWVFRIAGNEINQYFRLENRYKMIDGTVFEPGDDSKAVMEIEKKIDSDQHLMVLNKAIRRLKPVYQEIINLRYFEDLSYEEISEIMKKNESTIRVYSKRAREDLEKILKADAFKFLENYDF